MNPDLLRDHNQPCKHGYFRRCYHFINEAGEQIVMCPGGAPVTDDDIMRLYLNSEMRNQGLVSDGS